MPIRFDDPQLVQIAAVVAFLFGLAFGSFLNVVIYRVPAQRSVVHPGSACPKCGHAIRFYDNIPVLSWFLLRGRCRDCRAPISPRYWMVELLTALLCAGIVLRFGITLPAAKGIIFALLLVALIFIDADVHLLPDKLTLPGTLIGLLLAPWTPGDGSLRFVLGMFGYFRPYSSWHLAALGDAFLGAAVGSGLLFLVGEVYLRVRGREGMGFGDVKLMAMVGAFLGAQLTLVTIFFATFTGAIFGLSTLLVIYRKRLARWRVRKVDVASGRRRAWQSALVANRQHEIPFGVFLGGMALVLLFLGDRIAYWYWDLSL